MSFRQPFPTAQSKLIRSKDYIADPWLRLLQTLWKRTGGQEGIPSLEVTDITIISDDPFIVFDEEDASANNQLWRIIAENEALKFQVQNDAESVTTTFMQVERTGTVVDSITLTAAALVAAGELTVTGAFTSLGIDDNATGERLQLADTLLTLGGSGASFDIVRNVDDQRLVLSGGTGINNGASVELYGGTHATLANDVEINANGTRWFHYDSSFLLLTLTTILEVTGVATFLDQVNVNRSGSTVADGNADEFVIRDQSSNAGMSILGITTGFSNIVMGDSGDVDSFIFKKFGTSHATQANDLSLSIAGTVRLLWDESDGAWEITGNLTTAGDHILTSTSPLILFDKTNASANQKWWGQDYSTDGQAAYFVNNDAFSTFTNYMNVFRSGTTITEIEINATTVDLNGVVDFNSNPTGHITAATYTATLTNGANVAASTFGKARYMRTGPIVHVAIEVDIDPTAATTLTSLGISLPVASNIGTSTDISGVGTSTNGTNGYGEVVGNVGSDRAELQCFPVGSANASWWVMFTYTII